MESEHFIKAVKLSKRLSIGDDIISMEVLNGLTNKSYKVATTAGIYVFRFPGEGTEDLINRHDEKISTELANALGIDAELVYFDAQTGMKVSKYIDEAITMNPQAMCTEENITLAASLLRKLHTSGVDTKVNFDFVNMANKYISIIKMNSVSLFADQQSLFDKLILLNNKDNELKKVPCHNDPLCENWIRSYSHMYLIDWEYAGMNNPMWDLADLSIESDMTEKQDEKLLTSYFRDKLSRDQLKGFVRQKVYIDFLWSLWGKARVPFDGNQMEEYAEQRYSRMLSNLLKLEAIS